MAFNPQQKGPISEINVTPLVDVMLVLLVIFMVSAPLLYNGVALKLPKTQKNKSANLDSQQIVISLKQSGEVFIGKDQIKRGDLVDEVERLLKEYKKEIVFLRADGQSPYEEVAQILSELRARGIVQISLLTESSNKP